MTTIIRSISLPKSLYDEIKTWNKNNPDGVIKISPVCRKALRQAIYEKRKIK